jgi:uncharacterized membrane protein
VSGDPPTKLQVAAVPVGLIAYASLCHYSNSAERGAVWGAPLALAPLLLVGFGAAWRHGRRAGRRTDPPAGRYALAAALAAAALAAIYLGWDLLERNFTWIYLLQECGFYGLLAFGFGRSLRRGKTPLCTMLADRVHGPLSAGELRYTRAATAAWCIFFTTLVALELLLFLTVPLASWSFFSYFCTLPLVLLMFIAEFAVRRRILPGTAGAGLWATMRIYFARSA